VIILVSKKQLYNELFKRLKKVQLTIKEPEISDVTAEIFNDTGGLVAVITADDRLIYSGCQCESANIIVEIASDLKKQFNLSSDLPVKPIGNLPNGYMKLYEVGDIVMGCRLSPLIGYEYATRKKGMDYDKSEVYYYARQFLCFKEAQQDFAERCGFIEKQQKVKRDNLFSNAELSLLLSCCIERVKLDAALTSEVEKAIGYVISKIEQILPAPPTDSEQDIESENVRCFR